MKTIGIKLADGSFYPILEEGTAKTYQLDLTTVKDGQTKVLVDLYRSENKTMDDAEYVDTLEISNLIPHPNGEAELHLSVGLNENNELDAKVVDSETGSTSETTLTLVSRTMAEREEPANFELSTDDAEEVTVDGGEELSLPDGTDSSEIAPPLEDDDLNIDFGDVPFSFDDEIEKENVQTETAAEENQKTADDDFDSLLQNISDENSAPAAAESDDFSSEDVSSDATAAENSADTADGDMISEPLPDIDFSDDKFEDKNDDFSAFSAELPDFDDTMFSGSDVSTPAAGLTGYFNDPDFKNDPVFTETNLDTSDVEMDFDTSALDIPSENENTVSGGSPAMDFSDLYDEESLNVNSDDGGEEKKNKTRVPMIVCIICAIICVIATLLVLFVIPSKYNLIKHKNSVSEETETVTETSEEFIQIEENSSAEEESAGLETVIEVPEAKEDEIVVAETAEVVVPAVPEPPKVEEKKDVSYRIKWGDTLWDISDAYYKNPWRYPKIANYNNIKDPDVIISGTDILIPVE